MPEEPLNGPPVINLHISLVTHMCYAYNTQVAVVEADPETGEVKVLTVLAVNDVGKVLNRQAIEGQVEGGVMMGLGYALSEEFVVQQGINLTDRLDKVGLPGADRAPEIVPIILEIPHPFGPQGVKGFAEAPSLATAPAIINAKYDALGVRITDLPANPQKVLAAIQAWQELNFIRKPPVMKRKEMRRNESINPFSNDYRCLFIHIMSGGE